MRVDIETSENGAATVTPYGRISSDTSEDFWEEMRTVLKDTDRIVLDLKEVDYISSSGLRVLLRTKQTLGKKGIFRVINVGKRIKEIFDLTGFSNLLDIQENDGAENIKIAFFDIDGTLLPADGVVPESTKRAIKAAQERGLEVVIATGRDMVEIEKLPLDGIDFDGYLTLNGNICLDKEENMIAGNPIDPGEVEILVSIFRASKIPFVLIGKDKRYINYVDDVVVRTQLMTNGTIPDIGKYRGGKIYQCLAFIDNEMQQKLEELLDQCVITSWNETGKDIIAKTGGKDSGMKKYLEARGLRRSESIAFGDGFNDIPMIKYAGIGVAMGNAKEELKEEADYVTSDCDKGGIEEALRHYGLIE